MEMEELIKKAFDETTPDNYEKTIILSEIGEREMDITGRKTPMQKVFFVRRVCMACLLAMALLLFSGGTYTAVSRILNERSHDKECEKYREKLISVLRGEEDNAKQQGVLDNRLADALEKCNDKCHGEKMSGAEVIYLGQLNGEGLSDAISDKKKESRLIAVAVIPDTGVDMQSYKDDIYVTVNIDGADYNDKTYPPEAVCDFVYDSEWYVVYDVSNYDIYADRKIRLRMLFECGDSIVIGETNNGGR